MYNYLLVNFLFAVGTDCHAVVSGDDEKQNTDGTRKRLQPQEVGQLSGFFQTLRVAEEEQQQEKAGSDNKRFLPGTPPV